MGVDVYLEVKIPPEVSRKELEKCFIRGKSSDIYYWHWYPTREYLDAWLVDFKECMISRLKFVYPKMSEEEIDKEYHNKYNEAEMLEELAHYTVYEKKSDPRDKNGDGSVVLSDTCRAQCAIFVLNASVISKFFPNVKIESEYSDDFGNGPTIDIWLNGERVK